MKVRETEGKMRETERGGRQGRGKGETTRDKVRKDAGNREV